MLYADCIIRRAITSVHSYDATIIWFKYQTMTLGNTSLHNGDWRNWSAQWSYKPKVGSSSLPSPINPINNKERM